MRLSLNWIADFVDIDEEFIEELPQRLTMSTAEVEGVEVMGEDVRGVVVGRITSISPHPGSEKLKLIRVDIGDGEGEAISVCGAPNIYVGMMIPFAKVGGYLPGIGDVVSTEIRGAVSNGIACSFKDLGIGESHEGVIDISDDCRPGDDVKELFGIDDLIIEIDNKSLTHRPDLWGHYGFAREIAAITDSPLKALGLTSLEEMRSAEPLVKAKIHDEEKCARYTAVGIDGIRIASSPARIATRLAYVGMRPINNIVDLTNYVMLEIGQPMHAFDSWMMGDVIDIMTMSQLVSAFGQQPFFTTLDGIRREIPPETLMITSEGRAVGIAGIMGGENSEVSPDTSRIILESATFDAASIRRSAIFLGLRSEASMRFEKSLDTNLALEASRRFLYLLKCILPGVRVYSGLHDAHPRATEPIKISLRSGNISKYMGEYLSADEIERILKSLGFGMRRIEPGNKGNIEKSGYSAPDAYLDGQDAERQDEAKPQAQDAEWEVTVPTYRATKDITRVVDLVEEVARIYGYDNIEYKPLESAVVPTMENRRVRIEHRVRDILAGRFDMNEVHTYAWYDKEWNRTIGYKDDENLRIINPGISKLDTLRRDILPNLLSVAAKNEGFYDRFSLFEIASAYHPSGDYMAEGELGVEADSLRREERRLGAIVHWKGRAQSDEDDAMAMLKLAADEICSSILNRSAIFNAMEPAQGEVSYMHPVKRCSVALEGREIGYITIINPQILPVFEQNANMALMDINLSAIAEMEAVERSYTEPSRYPEVHLDFSILVPRSMMYDTLRARLEGFEHKYLRSLSYAGSYSGKGLPEDKKSITVSIKLGSDEATLSSDDISLFSESFISWLEREGLALR